MEQIILNYRRYISPSMMAIIITLIAACTVPADRAIYDGLTDTDSQTKVLFSTITADLDGQDGYAVREDQYTKVITDFQKLAERIDARTQSSGIDPGPSNPNPPIIAEILESLKQLRLYDSSQTLSEDKLEVIALLYNTNIKLAIQNEYDLIRRSPAGKLNEETI